MNEPMTVTKISLATLIALLLSTQMCLSSADDNQWKPWLITLAPGSYPQYLDYPGSLVSPMDKVEVSYAQPDNEEAWAYEDLMYAKGKAVGCRRWNDLDITPGTVGVIRVLKTTTNEQLDAAVNALERVYLDLCIGRCMTKYAKVPSETFDMVISALRRDGFRPLSESPDSDGEIILRVVSEPAGKLETLLM